MKKDNAGCGCLLVLGIIFFPILLLKELARISN
jgi:hypothetical protein